MSKLSKSNSSLEQSFSLTHPFQRGIIAKSLKGERLAEAIDLVIVFALWKRQQFGFEFRQKRSTAWKEHLTGLELGGLNVEARDLVPVDRHRLDSVLPGLL